MLQIAHVQERGRVLLCAAHDATADAYFIRLAALHPELAKKMTRVRRSHSSLTYADVCKPKLTYADVCGRMLTRMLTYAC